MPPFSDHDDAILPAVLAADDQLNSNRTVLLDLLKTEEDDGTNLTATTRSTATGVSIESLEMDISSSIRIEVATGPLSPLAKPQVHFYPYGEYRHIETLEEYTDEEMEACWYSEEEILAIKTANKLAIRKESSCVGNNKTNVDSVENTRGLEAQKHEGYLALRRLRDASISSVLNEQRRQWQLGSGSMDNIATKVEDPEIIRESYICFSRKATCKALALAEIDALEALRIQHDDPVSWRLKHLQQTARPCWLFFNPFRWFSKGHRDALIET